MIMFSLGVFVLITSCVRLWSLYSFGESVNPTWDYTDVIIWTGLEVAVSIIVPSLPAIRVLINRRMPGLLGSVLGMKSGNGIWGPDGEYRGFGGRSDASISSFGDTTFVSSTYSSGIPALKRLSAISHVSSLKVERLTGSSWGYGGSCEEEDGKGGGERAGQETSQAIDFSGEKGSREMGRTRSETRYSYARSVSFEVGKEEGNEAVTLTGLRSELSSPVRPLPHPPPRPTPARSESRPASLTVRPLPHPPVREKSPTRSPRALPYPPARPQSQIRPQGPRPLSPPDRVKMLRREEIATLPNIADVLRTERSAESLSAQLPSRESGLTPVGMGAMTIRKVEEGT